MPGGTEEFDDQSFLLGRPRSAIDWEQQEHLNGQNTNDQKIKRQLESMGARVSIVW